MPRKKNAESRAYYYLIGSEVAGKLSNGQTLVKSDLTKFFRAIDEKADSTSLPKKIKRFFDILSPVFKREDVGNKNFKIVFVDPTISMEDAAKAIDDALCYRFKIKKGAKKKVAGTRKKSIVAPNMKLASARLIGKLLNYFVRRKITAIRSNEYYTMTRQEGVNGCTLSNKRAERFSNTVSNVTGLPVKWNYINIPEDGRYLTIDGSNEEIKAIYLKWVEFVKTRFGIDLPVDKNNAIVVRPSRVTPPVVAEVTTTTPEKEISYSDEEKYVLWLTAKTLQDRGKRGIDADVFLTTLRAKILESRVKKINSRVEYQTLLRKEKIFEIGRNGLICVNNVEKAVQVLEKYDPKKVTTKIEVVSDISGIKSFLNLWGKGLTYEEKYSSKNKNIAIYEIVFNYTYSSMILFAILQSYLDEESKILENQNRFDWMNPIDPAIKYIMDNVDKFVNFYDPVPYFKDQFSGEIQNWEK